MVLSFIWFASMFPHGEVTKYIYCLYANSWDCQLGRAFLEMGGKTAYTPYSFWLGVIVTGIGAFLRYNEYQKSLNK